MDAQFPSTPGQEFDFWRQGMDRRFFGRVYKRSLQVGLVAVLATLGLEQREIAYGIGSGVAVSLMSTWTVEIMVRLLFNGGGSAGLKLAIGALVKLPIMLTMLMGVAWACFHGKMNVFGVLGGVVLVHAVMFVMVASTAVSQSDRLRERFR